MTAVAPEPPAADKGAPAGPRPLSLSRALGLLAATLVAVGLLGQVNLFGLLQDAITKGDEAERMQ
ncbi:MAG: hypothetical protein ABJE95_38800, partial [Byssovorax sp.]